VGLTTPHHKKTAVTEPQERRPRPDIGCRTIGWMDISVVIRRSTCEVFSLVILAGFRSDSS
jgi:hypothetical protein